MISILFNLILDCLDVSGKWEANGGAVRQLVTLHQAQDTCTGTAYDENDAKMWTYSVTFDEIRRKDNDKEEGRIVDEGVEIIWLYKTSEQPTGEIYTLSSL